MEPNKEKDKKLYLLMGILVIIILIVLRNLITSNNDAIMDYGDIESGYQVVVGKPIITDREIYYIMQDIVTNFVNSYSTFAETSITSYADYYSVLNKSYKNKISKSEYMELAKNFFSKLQVDDTSGMGSYTYYQTVNVIRNIYEIEQDAYMCVVGKYNTNNVGYLGIKLETYSNTFEIFYIE